MSQATSIATIDRLNRLGAIIYLSDGSYRVLKAQQFATLPAEWPQSEQEREDHVRQDEPNELSPP